MSDDSKMLMPGDRWQPTAEVINDFQNAADYVRVIKDGVGPSPAPCFDRQQVIATLKNRSGRDCQRFDILGIDGPIFQPKDDEEVFTSRVGLEGVVPRVADHTTRFVVLLEPVPKIDDDPEHPERQEATLVKACLVGVVPVRLKVVLEWHPFAHIADDDTTRLVSDCVGYPILWKDAQENEDEYGNRWALVKIGGQAPAMGVWRNAGYLPVGAHEQFRIAGVGADADHATVVVGWQPTNRFGPDYGVNGSQGVPPGGFGVCQRSNELHVAFADSALLEPGEHLGPVPGEGAVARHHPPTCRTLGIIDSVNRIALAESCRPMQRFKLMVPLVECGTALAQIMGRFGLSYSTLDSYLPDTVSDSLRAVAQSPLAVRNKETGKLFIPAGKCLNARYARAPGDFWEAIDFSECSCDGSFSSSSSSSAPSTSVSLSSSGSPSSTSSSSIGSSSSGSPSQSRDSGSSSDVDSHSATSSDSPSSSSGSPSSGSSASSSSKSPSSDGSRSSKSDSASQSSGSASESASRSESGSELPPEPSDTFPSTSGPSGSGSRGGSSDRSADSSRSAASSGSGSDQTDPDNSNSGHRSDSGSTGASASRGSDKSTAIVPASWSPTGYTALFIAESPEVRFDDVMVAKIVKADVDLPIDPRFIEVCAPDTVQVCGCVADIPVLVAAAVDGDKVRMRFAEQDPDQVVQVVLRLTGIRKGFLGHRFPDRTGAQFKANERFIRRAYPDA